MTNTNKRQLITGAALVAGVLGWYLFRPELLFVNHRVAEAAPVTGVSSPPILLSRGAFVTGAHETMGRASVQRVNGEVLLRLEGFSTSNGPDVRVILVAADSVTDSRGVKRAGFIDLGAMKGNIGDQNYVVPPGTDLRRYRAVSIWCRRFAVNFGSAALRS